MKSKTADKWLGILFMLNALMLMSALLFVFMPDNMMANTHYRLGLGEFPGMPIVEYLARSCSLLYGLHGIVLFVIARNLRKYRDLIPLLLMMHFGLGCFLLGIDRYSMMPKYWTWLEGPGIVAFSVLLLFLWSQSSYRNEPSS